MAAEQLSFLDGVDEREVRRIVAKELKQYKALKIAMKNRDEEENEVNGRLFPINMKYEREKELKVKHIDRALNEALDDIERKIIEQKYLSSTRVNDVNIYLELGLTKDQYYSFKKEAIFQIATALRII